LQTGIYTQTLDVAYVGQDATILCDIGVKSKVRWTRTSVGEEEHSLVFSGRKISSTCANRCSVTTATDGIRTLSNLTIANVSLQDAGKYRCSALVDDEEFQDSELLLLGKFPARLTDTMPRYKSSTLYFN
jgi:hypothetical protein